jgi:hypothetical protein
MGFRTTLLHHQLLNAMTANMCHTHLWYLIQSGQQLLLLSLKQGASVRVLGLQA